MGTRLNLSVGAMLVVGLFAGAPIQAQAQTDPGTNIPSLELNQADVRDALRALFRNVGVSYSIAPDVQGTVTLSLRNVPFETALRNVLNQVEATYRIEAGIYQIIRRQTPVVDPTGSQLPLPDPGAGLVVRRLRIRSADPMFIAMMLSESQDYTASPEISTIVKGSQFGGIGGGFGGGGGLGGGGLGGGGFGGGGLGGGGLGGGGFGGGGLGGGGFGGGGLGGGGFGGGGFGGGGMGGGGFGRGFGRGGY
jgi:hypothetical protein